MVIFGQVGGQNSPLMHVALYYILLKNNCPFLRTLILDIQVRLANGDQAYNGRVEIRYQNMWGTVTSSNFLESEAKVFCTAMGMR